MKQHDCSLQLPRSKVIVVGAGMSLDSALGEVSARTGEREVHVTVAGKGYERGLPMPLTLAAEIISAPSYEFGQSRRKKHQGRTMGAFGGKRSKK